MRTLDGAARCLRVALTVISMLAIVAATHSPAAALPNTHTALSGIYVHRTATGCGHPLSHSPVPGASGARALQITIAADSVTLRVSPGATTRVVELQFPERPVRGVSQYRYAGLGRWEDDALIVETRGPAMALWHPNAVERLLREVFSFRDDAVTYQAWAAPLKSETLPVVEVFLGRCSS